MIRERAEANTFMIATAGLALFGLLYLVLNPMVVEFEQRYQNTTAASTSIGSDAIGYLNLSWEWLPLFIILLFSIFVINGAVRGSEI